MGGPWDRAQQGEKVKRRRDERSLWENPVIAARIGRSEP